MSESAGIPSRRPGARVGTPFPDDGPGACRSCEVQCERVVYPSGCRAAGCTRLYTYLRDGREVMGCLDKVFWAEIDVAHFTALQQTRDGFGGLRVWRTPRSICQCAVVRTFAHRPHGPCIAPEFGTDVIDSPSV
jgi:hypothetical protein